MSPSRLSSVAVQATARGRSADLVEIVLPGRSWSELHPGNPVFASAARTSQVIVWTVPLTVQGMPVADTARGAADAQWMAFADAIARSGHRGVVRLLLPAEGDPDSSRDAFRRVADIVRARSGAWIEWTAPVGSPPSRAGETWPGADVVDIVGIDVPRSGPWSSIAAPSGGVIDWSDFARENKRPISVHWTLDKQANPPWIRNMAGWVALKAAKDKTVAYETVAQAATADPAGIITYRAMW